MVLIRQHPREGFPKANPHIFKELDLNKDKSVDHDEWHKFKEAHGMRDHE